MIKQSLRQLLYNIRQDESPLPPWGVGLALGLVVIYLIVIGLSLIFAASSAGVSLEDANPSVIAWAGVLAHVVSIFIIFQYVSVAYDRAIDSGELSKNTTLQTAVRLVPSETTPTWGVVMMALIIAIFADVVSLAVGVPTTSLPLPMDGLQPSDGFPFLMAALVIVILRPIVVETLFRGVLYGALIKQFKASTAIIVTVIGSAVLTYALDPTYLWWGGIYPLVTGTVAALARAGTKSLLVAIGVHMMFGLFVVLRALLLL